MRSYQWHPCDSCSGCFCSVFSMRAKQQHGHTPSDQHQHLVLLGGKPLAGLGVVLCSGRQEAGVPILEI